jgi:hypothetical protein
LPVYGDYEVDPDAIDKGVASLMSKFLAKVKMIWNSAWISLRPSLMLLVSKKVEALEVMVMILVMTNKFKSVSSTVSSIRLSLKSAMVPA